MDIKDLTETEKAVLLRQLASELRAKKEKKQGDKETLNMLTHEFVEKYFPILEATGKRMSEVKGHIFDDSKTILELKKEAYELSDDAMLRQQSHSLSTENCDKTIIIGHNTIDGWDESLAASGIDKVNKWLASKMTDENKDVIDMVRDLLKPNKEGLLKANRVIELSNRASKIGDPILIEAVGELQKAYQPRKTTTYVKAKFRNEDGQDVWLNLSMSNA
jgi:wobble nucleotide-excising tRNase